MERREINEILSNLSEDEFGWQVAVPESVGQFFGLPVRIEIETRAVGEDDEGPLPAVNDLESNLARMILGNLPAILAEAEKQFIRYTAENDPDAKEQVRDPHIWINRDDFEDGDDMERWTFVIGREDQPDFGYHIEFDGRKCLEIWAGD